MDARLLHRPEAGHRPSRGGGECYGHGEGKKRGGASLFHAAIIAGALAGVQARALEPLTEADFPAYPPEQVALGRALFSDPILSGAGDIACATCHARRFGLSDGVSLGLGSGARGAGMARTGPVRQRVSRNAPGLWALGARQMRRLFWDGRVERLADGRLRTPLGARLPRGLSGPLAAQALFPLISPVEMAGRHNAVADAGGPEAAWAVIARRVSASPRYPDLTIVEIANALAAYIATAFRATDTAYDRFVSGDRGALDARQQHGLALFFGKARCANCHTPPLFTDQEFHGLGLPHIGPGRAAPFDPVARDTGRFGVTSDPADAYRFRTPPLRGVALTAPYGHNGAWPTLAAIIRQHLDPARARAAWSPEALRLPPAPRLTVPDWATWENVAEQARALAAADIRPLRLSEEEISALVAFLHALSPPQALEESGDTPHPP